MLGEELIVEKKQMSPDFEVLQSVHVYSFYFSLLISIFLMYIESRLATFLSIKL